jgi:hypothetical protein
MLETQSKEDGKLKPRIIFMAFVFVLGMSAFAMAQDDTAVADDTMADDTSAADDDASGVFAATFEFTAPEALTADMEYDFSFTVANTTTGDVQRWIYDIEMYLPTINYSLLNADSIPAPTALHDGEWTAERVTDETDNGTFEGIHWQFNGTMTSESYGDIREGDSLDFNFSAKTDADASDGFPWRMIALDENEVTYDLTGTSYVGGDDDTTTDDTGDDTADDDLGGGDDDDGGGGGCGC